jgi:secreted PhoX family phosphatase
MNIEIDVTRNIYDKVNRTSITVRQDVDGLGLIEIISSDDVRLVINHEMASALAQVLFQTHFDLEERESDAFRKAAIE